MLSTHEKQILSTESNLTAQVTKEDLLNYMEEPRAIEIEK